MASQIGINKNIEVRMQNQLNFLIKHIRNQFFHPLKRWKKF